MQTTPSGAYSFGPFLLDTGSYRLMRGDTVVQVSPKIIDLLLYLVVRPSILVTKDELFNALWPDVAVTDNALTQAVSELRQALGDDPSNPKYVQTVARRGYRFVAAVVSGASPTASRTDVQPAESTARAPVVGVLDFANVSNDASLAWLSSGIAETLTNDLRSALQLRIIDRTRVVEAVRRVGTDHDALRRELHIDLAIVGSFQRAGDRLRITARAVDATTGEALADSKADGLLDHVFDLQDRVVAQLAETIGTSPTVSRRPHRETSSLEAYQAFTEGRLKLETLEPKKVAAAVEGFERAIRLDPHYAAAHVGLGNARFWQYEMSRAGNHTDAALLARAIDHVRRAIELERDLAEAHATLAFLLVSAGRATEALASARRAVALEPGQWAHHFRVAHAAWGEERLRSLARVTNLYPDFPFAHFEAAMVHIARGALDRAESVLREGTIVQDRQADLRQRYPARGLHWLLGLVRLAQEDVKEAEAEFSKERAFGTEQLYGAEFVMNACDGTGFARLRAGDHHGAASAFEEALKAFPDHARSLVGLGTALRASGKAKPADAAFARAAAAIDALRRGGRSTEATLAHAFLHATTGAADDSIRCLKSLLEKSDLPFSGWTIPIEPLLDPLRGSRPFQDVLDALSARAR